MRKVKGSGPQGEHLQTFKERFATVLAQMKALRFLEPRGIGQTYPEWRLWERHRQCTATGGQGMLLRSPQAARGGKPAVP